MHPVKLTSDQPSELVFISVRSSHHVQEDGRTGRGREGLHANGRADERGGDLTNCPGHGALSGHQVVVQTVQAAV